ncbi:MAG: hypothetical protein PWP04_68 [Candidatus Atribacteria bacterium]|nr:hypothetical protein [Candidatus Atribacteria bacterium]
MEVVVSHEGTDFDALASMAAVSKLYPGVRIVLPGSVSRNVRHFLSLYGHFWNCLKEGDVDWDEVTKVYVVDTTYPDRIGKAGTIVNQEKVSFFFFDHHWEARETISKTQGIIQNRGACATILVEKIREKSILLTPLEATLLLLGIYEDTGSFTFSTTTSQDLEAASFLVSQGAKVIFVPRFSHVQLTPFQQKVLKEMINSLEVKEINGIPVHFTSVNFSEYVEGVSWLVHKLMELEEIEVLFSLFVLEDKIYVIARSRLEEVEVNKILQLLAGGGGHKSAASCSLKNLTINQVKQQIINILEESLSFIRAREVMSFPVKTVQAECPAEEALLPMIRFGFSGLPVVDANGQLIGIVTRKDIEKALTHNLDKAPVKSLASQQVLTVNPDDSIFRVRNLMVEKDVGRIPVVKDGQLLGIITRSDILRVFHQKDNLMTQAMTKLNLSEKVYFHFSADDLKLLSFIGGLAKKKGIRIYLVGGVVRDIILGYPNLDLDLVVEGEAIEFARFLADQLKGKLITYPPFGTAVLFLPGRRIDFASARREFYPAPGATPWVEYSNLRRDLFRRDFTINAMAISIHPDNWGELFDFFGGLKDLENKLIRVLHPLSFVDDPARAIRAIRFEQKYHFQIEPFTMSLLQQTVQAKLLNQIKPDRLKEELTLILRLPGFYRYLERLSQLGMFPFLLPGCKWETDYLRIYQNLEKIYDKFQQQELDPFLLKLSPLLADLANYYLPKLEQRLHLSKTEVAKIRKFRERKEEFEREIERPNLNPSEIYLLCQDIPKEFLFFYLAFYYPDRVGYQRIAQYINHWSTVKPYLNGKYLKEKGIPEGPIYAKILREIKLARLDGKVTNQEEEKKLVEKIWERMKLNGKKSV